MNQYKYQLWPVALGKHRGSTNIIPDLSAKKGYIRERSKIHFYAGAGVSPAAIKMPRQIF